MNRQTDLLYPCTTTARMKSPFLLFLLVLSLLLPDTLRANTTQPFLFFYSGNVQGEIDPCG